jgi:hypothetical protein
MRRIGGTLSLLFSFMHAPLFWGRENRYSLILSVINETRADGWWEKEEEGRISLN